MPVQQFDLGPTPHLIITSDGMLDVRGGTRDDVRLESDATPLTVDVNTSENVLEVKTPGSCAIQMPGGGRIEVGATLGNLRVRDLESVVAVESVYGTASVRGVQGLRLGTVHGEGRIRDIGGRVEIQQANGSLAIQDVVGDVQVELVNGDLLLRDVSGSMDIRKVNGALAVRTDFVPETTSRFAANVEANFRVSTDADVRFLLPLTAEVMVDRGVPVTNDGEHQVVTLGSGAATVEVSGPREVVIRQRGQKDEETAFAQTFAFSHDFSEHLADITAQIETGLAAFEAEIGSAISDRVLSQVERRLSQARRQVAAAQRRVEREAERHINRFTDIDVSSGRNAPETAGMSEDERLAVLTMLEEGKISVEEAEKLLSALEGK